MADLAKAMQKLRRFVLGGSPCAAKKKAAIQVTDELKREAKGLRDDITKLADLDHVDPFDQLIKNFQRARRG